MSLLLLLRNPAASSIDPLLADWRVLIRDFSGAIVDELDNWLTDGGGLVAEAVFNGVGAFTISMSADGVSARIIDESCGVIITKNDEVVFSGQILTEFTRTGTTITAAGLSDEYLLQRPALPDPLNVNPTVPYDVVTASASAVMRQYAFNNMALPFARADRVVSNLLIEADPALGGTLTGRAGGEALLSVLQQIAATPIAGGLGFRIRQSSATASTRTFSIYAPEDKSGEVMFGIDLGTASDFEDTRAAPEANYWYVMGGDGLGMDGRSIIGDGDAALIAQWGLLEKLYDARGITDSGELQAKLAELLAGSVASRRVTVTPFETESLQFVDHWNLGDIVSFVGPDGVPFVDVIRSARIEMGADGVRVRPVVSEAGDSGNQLVAQHLASVQDRLSNIERNWTVPDASIITAMLTTGAVTQPKLSAASVSPVKLDAIDVPANNEVSAYDSATQHFKWFSFTELAGTTATLTNLTVTGNTILGDNAALDVLTVNAVEIHNGSALFKALTQISNSALTVVATFDPTAGAQQVILGNQTTPGLFIDVANGRTMVRTATPLSSAADDVFTVVGGTSYFAGNSGPSIGLRYNASQTGGWTLAVSAAGANPSLLFNDDAGLAVFTLRDTSAGYQAAVTGNIEVSGVGIFTSAVSAGKAVLNGTAFVGSEILRVVSGSSILEGKVTVTASGVDVTGSSIFRNAVSFTAGGVDISGGLIINNTGISVTTGGISVSAGGIDITGSSIFQSGLTVAGGLGVTTGAVAFPNTSIGFYGASAIARPTVTGAKAGNAALTSLMAGLAALGLVTDSTT